ncbi:hypothetical protein CHUAL_008325 [Chamberlinius hualienensis]
MMTKTTTGVIIAAICLLISICSVSSQCCDFDLTTCSWSNSLWVATPDKIPNLIGYPDFDRTKPGGNYIFLQNIIATDGSITTFHISAPGNVISFDYFMDSSDPTPNNVQFEAIFRTSGGFETTIFSTGAKNSLWQHQDIQCDSTNAYCCGGMPPCDGTLQVTGIVNVGAPTGLFAVDNIGMGCPPTTTTATTTTSTTTTSPTTTTTTPTTTTTTPTTATTTPTTTTPTTTMTTTAPPPPIPCCDFEVDACGASIGSWKLSKAEAPTIPIPTMSGNFLWSDAPGEVTFSRYGGITSSSIITISYFINSGSSSLTLSFHPDNGGLVTPFQLIPKDDDNWNTDNFICTKCCGTDLSCYGQFVLTGNGIGGGDYEQAIDNFDVDGQCNSFHCCYFDDTSNCQFSTKGETLWISSVTKPPQNPPPNGQPFSGYIYFEVVNYVDAADINDALNSVSSTISADTKFRGNIYAESNNANNKLEILFVNTDAASDVSVLLGTVSDTVGMFRIFDADCAVSKCCGDDPTVTTCTGYIQFKAIIEKTTGGTALFAIDAFEITDSCGLFPVLPQCCAATSPTNPVTATDPIPCCDFETDECGVTSDTWQLSKDVDPTLITIPQMSGSNLWSNEPGQVTFTMYNGIKPSSVITFSYFINSDSSSLSLVFYHDGGAPTTFSPIYNVDSWNTATFTCTGCCGTDASCDGQFVLTGNGIGGADYEMAIDNFDVDGQCYSSFSCCYFDDVNNCNTANEAGSLWTSSQVKPPQNPPPNNQPFSEYIYFEVVNYVDATDICAVVHTVTSTIDSNTKFRGNIYAESNNANNKLQIWFVNTDPVNGGSVLLRTVSDTVGMFRIFDADCAVSKCCGDDPTITSCNGYIQFKAIVEKTTGGTALFAIDAFEIADSCGLFPASSQCCYTTADCSWTGIWLSYPDYTPTTADYPNFWKTSRSTTFKFIQDQSATEVSDTIFLISEPDTVINTGFTVLIATILTPSANWQYDYFVTCDSSVSYCCGAVDVPCEGKIRLTSNIDASYLQGLFAFDHIGECGFSPTLTQGTVCCSFDTFNCASSSSDWYWSATIPSPIPSPGSTYLWTDIAEGVALFPIVSVEIIGTTFSLNYYIDSPAANIKVDFYPIGVLPVQLGTLSYTAGNWNTTTFNCVLCCDLALSCNGQLGITSEQGGGVIVAVDTVLMNSDCFPI